MNSSHEKSADCTVPAIDPHGVYEEFQDSERLAARLENLLDAVTALAELDFSKRAEIHGDGAFLDGLAYGLNVLNEELRASTVSRDYYDGIIRSMAEGLLVVDARDTIADVNPALCRLLGYAHAELIGRPWSILCRRSRAELMAEGTAEVTDESDHAGPQWRVETELVRADGGAVEVALSGSLLHRPNDEDDWMFVVQDITTQKDLARSLAEARDAAVHSAQVTASFLANMSHEIRTPLNGVIGMAWLLLDDGAVGHGIDPATLAKIETIHDCATLLLDIVNDILDLSKLESGNVQLSEEELELASSVEDLLHVYAVRAEQKNLELVAVLSPRLPTRIRADVGSLRQVLGNLISNAIKFTSSGEVVVEVRCVEAPEGPGIEAAPDRTWLRFEVSDTGIGIPEHLQGAIFQPFQQAETSTARKYGGTGLGLTICRRLVELMGGRIGCDSQVGRGATFWFELPCQVLAGPAVEDEPRMLAGQRILVVDDNARQRWSLARSIEHWGGQAQLASDGAQALEILRDAPEPPSLALVDWPSTTEEGTRLLRELAERSGGAMQIVLLTSLSSTPPMAELRSLGVIRALAKPVKHSRLRSLLRHCIEGHGEPLPHERLADVGPRLAGEAPVLVVEDNPVNQAVVLGQLRRLGLTAHVVGDGREAVQAVAERRFSVVLMDLYMPRMDGYEATERIRQHEHGADLPIVAVTANATEQIRKRCFSLGMDDFLTKPLRLEALLRSLSRWLVLRTGEAQEADEGARSLAVAPRRRDRSRTVTSLRELEGPRVTLLRDEEGPRVTLPRGEDGPGVTSLRDEGPRVTSLRDEEGPRVTPTGSVPVRCDRHVFPAEARVLVVDDDRVNRRVLLGMLGRLGIAVDEARGGAQAIVAASERHYDMVLMDVEMSGIDGLAATRMIRGTETSRRTPVIAVTGHDSGQERARCAAADMDDFLTKPLRMLDLLTRLTLWLGLEPRPDARTLVAGLRAPEPISLETLEPLEPLIPAPGSLAEIRKAFVRAARECVARLRATLPSRPEWDRDLFALVTWTANVGAVRLAGLAATLERCRPDERAFLLELLDREIADLAHSWAERR